MSAHRVRSYGLGVTTNERSTDILAAASAGDHNDIPQYEIRVKGHLGPRWAAWFDGLSLTPGDDGTTVIRGKVVDQAALHGVLQRVRDLGIPLVSLIPVPSDAPMAPTAPRTNEGN
jgi:hypothetical protein